jgi:3-hydroxybutyryl-CoA dehydrogenase
MLKGPGVECVGDPSIRQRAEEILERVNKRAEWLPDKPGMVAPRVVSMIINEAWFALEEQVSSREDIDTAMLLGTNYPYGPFTWGDKIGLKKIVTLLQTLEKEDPRYSVASLLLKEAFQ